MHWAEENGNPLLALRTALASNRWEEMWMVIEGAHRQQVNKQRQERRQQHHHQQGTQPAVPKVILSAPPPVVAAPVVERLASNARPAADHPWRKAWSKKRQREQAAAA